MFSVFPYLISILCGPLVMMLFVVPVPGTTKFLVSSIFLIDDFVALVALLLSFAVSVLCVWCGLSVYLSCWFCLIGWRFFWVVLLLLGCDDMACDIARDIL